MTNRPQSISSPSLAGRRARRRFAPWMLATLTFASWSTRANAYTENPPTPVPVDRPTPPEPPPPISSIGALAGVGFPRPISFEVLTKLGGYVGLGVEYGLLPAVSIDGFSASAWAVSFDTRIFPFRGAFFLGLRGGYQRIDANASVSTLSESADLTTWFLNPRLGFAWTFRPGFTIATEAGVQIPFSTSSSTTLPDTVALAVRDSSVVQTLSGVLPTVDLLRVGVIF